MPRVKIGKRKAEYSSARAKGESLPGYITRMFQRVEGHSKEYGLLPSLKRERKDFKDSKKAFKRDKKKVQFKKDGGKVKKVFPTNPSREQEARDYYTRKFGSKKAKAELGAKTRDRRKVKKVHGKKEGGTMEPYHGSMISGTVDGKKLSNPSYKKYYGNLLRGFK